MNSYKALGKINKSLGNQAKITNGLMVAQSFQMAGMNRSLKSVKNAMEQNSSILSSILDIQNDIKNIQTTQLDEAVLSNKLKQFEIEQNKLRYEKEQADKEYIRAQRNLAFELKNSVHEVDESDSTILEKYFFLTISLEIFEELDTEKFEISEMEYSREAYNSMLETKDKYKLLLTEKDNFDLRIIENIELEDENQYLTNLKKDLKRLERFLNKTDELKNINTKKSPNKIKAELNVLIKEIERNNED